VLFDRIIFFKAVIQAVEDILGKLAIVKIIFDLGIQSKAGKELTNKKTFGIGLTRSGLGNASGKFAGSRSRTLHPRCKKSKQFAL
jgi:hypothetical protein